ncbi:Transcriptional regulatory protein UhpA [Sandaracinus amylolyticus]|uniref:Transcriptional regulatory protein UhpA n=2 Tax=Sandaracinus amylolyticus TaxID=927083 RepID=A0A0F6SFH4_9BACT|nr:Transcriptional regulatory protein UhpA [Sandaracinus amylolyticus]
MLLAVPAYVIRLGPQRIRLYPGVSRVGRDSLCEIQLTDESVSRRHATIRVDEEGAKLSDDASRNGVRVNGEKIRGAHLLHDGDKIRVGTVEMQFEVEDEATDAGLFGAGTRPLPRPGSGEPDPLAALSPREREVLARLARGEAHRDIAEALDVSTKTIETYRARIGEKLGVKGRADLVRLALQAGLLSPDR